MLEQYKHNYGFQYTLDFKADHMRFFILSSHDHPTIVSQCLVTFRWISLKELSEASAIWASDWLRVVL